MPHPSLISIFSEYLREILKTNGGVITSKQEMIEEFPRFNCRSNGENE